MLEINSISSIVLIFISLIIHSLDILAFLCSLSLSLCNICFPPPPHHLSIPVQDRHCNYCNTGAVEDEFHFLLY